MAELPETSEATTGLIVRKNQPNNGFFIDHLSIVNTVRKIDTMWTITSNIGDLSITTEWSHPSKLFTIMGSWETTSGKKKNCIWS